MEDSNFTSLFCPPVSKPPGKDGSGGDAAADFAEAPGALGSAPADFADAPGALDSPCTGPPQGWCRILVEAAWECDFFLPLQSSSCKSPAPAA